MIEIAGAVQRAFTFPADLSTTCAYFGDFRRVISLLPHIRLVRAHSADHYRVLYHTVELGLYDVRIYCDLHARLDPRRSVLRVTPAESHSPVKARVTLTSLTASGRYQSTSEFQAAGRETQVNYRLTLNARLPKPLGLQLISDRAIERIAHSIVMWRIHEIADGFIERSIVDFEKRPRRRR
jgi:hypothetical protein